MMRAIDSRLRGRTLQRSGIGVRRWLRPVRRCSEAGYSLLEVLVVLSIIALIAAVVGPRLVGYLGKAKADTARI